MATVKPPIPVGSVKAAAHGTLGPATWVNVFYFNVTAGTHTPGEVIAAVVQAVHDFYANGFAVGALPNTWHLSAVTVSYRDATDSLVRVRVADALAGTNPSVTEDAQVCYLVNWSTGDPRRGGKPRQYVAGVPSGSMLDSAQLSTSVVTGITTTLLAWLVGLPGRAIPMQLEEMSFRNAGSFRDAAHTYPIIGVALNPVVATQRRRVNRLRPS